MKICSKCNIEKGLDSFSKNAKRDGYQTWCKCCVKEYDRIRHLDNKPYRYALNNKHLKRNREFIYNYLLDKSCVDCGEKDPVVLEFDHVQGAKIKPISDMVRLGFGITKITAEIDKCEIRCANCHRRKTANQFGYYRYRE